MELQRQSLQQAYLPTATCGATGRRRTTATGLSAGIYTVTVTDANGCIGEAEAEVESPTLLIAEVISNTDASCFGFADGSATVNATGGTTAYSYLWSDTI